MRESCPRQECESSYNPAPFLTGLIKARLQTQQADEPKLPVETQLDGCPPPPQ